MLEVKDLEPAVAQAALTQGLQKGPFRYAFELQQPRTLAELLELANSHVNIKEYNLEKITPDRPTRKETIRRLRRV